MAFQSRVIRCAIHRRSLLGLLVILAGCMTGSPQSPTTARHMFDLPAPLGATGKYETKRPIDRPAPPKETVKTPPRGSLTLPLEKESAPAGADSEAPPTRIKPALPKDPFPSVESGPSLESLPTIEPEDVTVSRPLELSISAPARRQLGGVATYRVALRNSGDRPQEDLVIHCQFDDALVFAGSKQREVLHRVASLPAGESKELALSLTSSRIGSHCCQFVVTRRDGQKEVEIASRQVCVDFVTRHVEIDLVGPTQRTEGSRAEFSITLANNSEKTIENVEAVVSYDKALVPREASAEAERRAGNLVWRLGALHAMEKVQLQVEFECRTQAHRACVAVDVKGANLAGEREEACLEIIPITGTLDLRVSDRTDPLETGKTGVYDVTVQNIGLQVARRIVVEGTIPENFEFRSATVRNGEKRISLPSTVEGNKVLFEAVDILEPNARLVYTIEVDALRAGPAEFRASLTSALGRTAVTTSEPTTVVDP